MDENLKKTLAIVGAALALILAGIVIFRTFTVPSETISTKEVPAKGIEKARGNGKEPMD